MSSLVAEIFLYLGLMFTICWVAATLLTRFVQTKILPLIKKSSSKHHSAVLAQLVVSKNGMHGTGLEDGLLAQYIAAEDTLNYRSRLFDESLAVDILNEGLKKYFKVEILTSVCATTRDSIAGSSCQVLVKLVGRRGNTIYVGYASYLKQFGDNTRNYYKLLANDSTKLEEWLVRENRFLTANSLYIVTPVTLDDDSDDLLDLFEVLGNSIVEEIPAPISAKKETVIWRFAYSPVAGYSLIPTYQTITQYSDQIVDLSYNDVPFTYHGLTKVLRPSQQVRIVSTALEEGENVAIFGIPGSGKTTFARQAMAQLSDIPGIRLISVSPSMVDQLLNPEAQGALLQILGEFVEVEEYDMYTDSYTTVRKQYRNIIMIDEAEQLVGTGISNPQALLRDMLDGEGKIVHNVSVMLVFNQPKEKLDPTIFRSGRIGVELQFDALPMERAKLLAAELKRTDLSRKFDAEEFHRHVTNVTTFTPAGFCTLADITSCFKSSVYADKISLVLTGMKAPRVERKPEVKGGRALGSIAPPGTERSKVVPIEPPTPKVVQSAPPKSPLAAVLPSKEVPHPSKNSDQRKRDRKRDRKRRK